MVLVRDSGEIESAKDSTTSYPFIDAEGHRFALPSVYPSVSMETHDRPQTILPNKLADLSCASFTPATLLAQMNAFFESNFPLTPGVETCLTEFIDDACDLGQMYGYLRPWVPYMSDARELSAFPASMRGRREKDLKLRSTAINSDRIVNPHVPARRIWDLLANRVLPYHAISPDNNDEVWLAKSIWAVSHSWVAPSERHSVLTPINGMAWRVPIPCGTTLEDIRNELLSLGAQYVFLDVLCLRQEDELLPEKESIRKREWRLDIPTIGYMYDNTWSVPRTIVVYFNGLGLPFLGDQANANDQFHWFNRVWTLQESPKGTVIVGGLKGLKKSKLSLHEASDWPSTGIDDNFLRLLRTAETVKSLAASNHMSNAIQLARSRYCARPVDRVACLAYILGCPTLPIYDADIDVEVAWSLLVECLPDEKRLELLFSDFGSRAQPTSWRPTWKQVNSCPRLRSPGFFDEDERLTLLDGSSPDLKYRYGFDAY